MWFESTAYSPPITTSRRFKCVFQKWVIALDILLEGSVLFLWAFFSASTESESDKFGFIRFKKGEILFRKTLKAISKNWNNSAIKRSWAAVLSTFPFVLSVSMNHCGYFTDLRLSFFAIYFQFLFVFMNEEHFESFKKEFLDEKFWSLQAEFLALFVLAAVSNCVVIYA